MAWTGPFQLGSLVLLVLCCFTHGIVAQTAEAPSTPADPCANNTCGAQTYCLPLPESQNGQKAYTCIAFGYRPGQCSLHKGLTCDQTAECLNSGDHQSFTCICPQDAVGDGYKTEAGGTGCKLAFKPCSQNNECPQYGYCDLEVYKCVCQSGFTGNGINCTDINECPSPLCDRHAICTNYPGGFTCTCDAKKNYVGDGYNCTLFCYNHNDCDFPRAICNNNNTCECKEGYEGNGSECKDVDECATGNHTCNPNAQCVNKAGGYDCKCKNGFSGNGFTCTKMPQSCADIAEVKPGKKYVIDPDFTGSANSFQVECDVIDGIVVTKVIPIGTFPLEAPIQPTDNPLNIAYLPTPNDIKPLLENSGYCYQDISFACYKGFALFPGTVWYDAYGQSHEDWGSSKVKKCACGELHLCPKSCYCDGSQTGAATVDSGRIVDKTRLPVVKVEFTQGKGQKGRVDIQPLICAKVPVDVPKDCNEAKFKYNIKKNTPLYIDVDGPGGVSPFLVFCDMESFTHVGVTEVPPDSPTIVPTTITGEPVAYSTDMPKMSALIQGSAFCSQKIEFQCQNSRLGPNGGYVSVSSNKRRLNYFPGANGVQSSCGCGATKSCAAPTVKCNCDIQDGQTRKDFGLIIDKRDLPVVAVTAEIGASRSGTYRIGNLRCSQKQFGIEPNCEKYRGTGVTEDYTYFIDPDGPGGLAPFPVECKFLTSPPQGSTIVHHNDEGPKNLVDANWLIRYLQATDDQIKGLKDRSTFCTQEIKVDCYQFAVQTSLGAVTLNGPGNIVLNLPQLLDSCLLNGGDCKCKANGGNSSDSGVISAMDQVPISSVNFQKVIGQLGLGGTLSVSLGPLVCAEVFPTCAELKKFIEGGLAVEGEADVVNGKFTVDPDGPGNNPAFQVDCFFPTTFVQTDKPNGGATPDPNNPGPVDVCFDITYTDSSGNKISPSQMTALVKKSDKCKQDLKLECVNAPATKMVNFTTCDGKAQPGWAGSFGEDKCACGVSGMCAGGPTAKCNCDMADSQRRSDEGAIIDTNQLPVCQICLKINPPSNGGGPPSPPPELKYTLGPLTCDGGQGRKKSCQDHRMEQGTMTQPRIDTIPINTTPTIPIGCELIHSPPIGILTVKPQTPVYPPKDDKPINIKIIYVTLNMDIIPKVLKKEEYCTQQIFIFCAKDPVQVGGNYGWYTIKGKISNVWTALPNDGTDVKRVCEQHKLLCQKCGNPRGFMITDKENLPVTGLALAQSGVTVVVGDVKCLDIKTSCQDVMDSNSKWTGYTDGTRWVIDPDGPGLTQPFVATCEFDKTTGNGVSVVPVKGAWVGKVRVTDQDEPAEFYLPVEYDWATPEQINSLAQISDFCWQGVKYECQYTPLLDSPKRPSYYTLFKGGNATSFGTGPNTDFVGCACSQTNTCLPGYTCNCDAKGKMAVDQGAITDKNALPVVGVAVGGQTNKQAVANVQVTSVRCSSKPVDPPKDCQAALESKRKFDVDYAYSSEYLISPDPENEVEPFMVRCDFDISPGDGVTVIRPKYPEDKPQDPKSGTPEKVPYYGPSEAQILALVSRSAYCYQGVRFDCYGSTLLSEGSYWLTSGSKDKRQFWGGGEPVDDERKGVCACGVDKTCGGLDTAAKQRARRCNCDVGDKVYRSDAGIIDIKEFLPISEIWFGRYSTFNQANLTIGDLYCSQKPLKFNECEMGFNDCHPKAKCVDTDNGYTCVCEDGWNGKGVVVSSRQARANGRECIDDNECKALNPCPYNAICTNTPGSFYCTCKPGYRQIGPVECEDINECTDPALNECGVNARCENLDGSYRCMCKKGYRGNGRVCTPIGECSCFGDPHCLSFDKKWLHFQGDCEYVMAQDGCGPNEENTFRVIVTHWKKGSSAPGYFSWIKSVRIEIFEREITLEQNGKILVDGILVREYLDPQYLTVTQINKRIKLQAANGLEVVWNGNDMVQIVVPIDLKRSMCGLCGDYNDNPKDDWRLGPACPEKKGQLTDKFDLFGRSWTVFVNDSLVCDVDCADTKPPVKEECKYPQALVEQECDKLLNLNTSPFKPCFMMKTEQELMELRMSCVFDLCHTPDDLDRQICDIANAYSKGCADEEKVELTGWREKVEACEVPSCSNNMVYMTCGPNIQPTCLTGLMNATDDATVCTEGCFCGKNMVMEGDRCIRPKDCGCFYDSGYMQVGDVVVLPDCSYKVQCYGKNVTSQTPVSCGMNEECRKNDGVMGCYCKKGYVMDDKNGMCKPDKCQGVVCEIDNMECFNGTCQCKMGFLGNCQQCDDLDECATGEHDCNKIGQKCINLDGSYACECEEGFLPSGSTCKDIDECEYGLDNCGDNAECRNTLGSFTCECCIGYKKGAGGECVRDTSASSAGGRCCACQGDKCSEPGQVCGTDGVTYSNYRALEVTACKNNNQELAVNYKGACQGSCGSVICEKQYAECTMKDGVPTCGCPKCEDSTSESKTETVCATNKVTYTSICHMKEATCEANIETTVEVEFTGRPCPGEGTPAVGPWGDWGECSEECKQGVKSRTRPVYVKDYEGKINDTESIPCYNTCEQGPCRADTCTGAGQVCMADDQGVPSCSCPVCDEFVEEPVCGRVGIVIQTYENQCELDKKACNTGQKDYEALEPRACEDKPTECGLIRNYKVEKDENGCEADRSLNFGACYGGCGEDAELCCYGNKEKQISATMYCPDGSNYVKWFNATVGCDCLATEEVNALKMKVVK